MSSSTNRGSVLAYVLVIMLVFLAWFNMHIMYTYDYVSSKEYLKRIDANLNQERMMLDYVRGVLPHCPNDFDLFSFECFDSYINVYYKLDFWFKYNIFTP